MAASGGHWQKGKFVGAGKATTQSPQLPKSTTRAISFWEDIQKRFPHNQVANWLNSLRGGHGDWFRNRSLVNVAVSGNSNNSRGLFSPAKYEDNMKEAEKIIGRHSEITDLMQW